MTSTSIPVHYLYAITEIGVKEAPGTSDNPRVREYHGATKAGPSPDSVFWCASFVNWCYRQAGIIGTRTRAARDWLTKTPPGFRQVPLSEAKPGDLVILERGSGGHATFYAGPASPTAFYGLGGNQQDQVNVGRYPNRRVLGVFRYGR